MGQWYIIYNGIQKGPMAAAELLNYGLTPDSMVWTAGMPDWRRAGYCADLNALMAASSGQVDVQNSGAAPMEVTVDVGSDGGSCGKNESLRDGNGNSAARSQYGEAPGRGPLHADLNNPGNWAGNGYGNSGFPQPGQWSGKSRVVAGLLAIFLGYLGVQYFYMDKIAAGIISIVLSIVTCGLWSVVTLIQGILMLTMTDRQFDDKYVYTVSTFPLF